MIRPIDTPDRMVLRPFAPGEPGLASDDRALVELSRCGFPVVAATRPRRDGAILATAAAIASLLGGLTFWSMSGNRSQPRAAPQFSPTPAPVLPATARQAPVPTPGLVLPSVPSVAAAPGALVSPEPQAAPVMVYDASSPSASGSAPPATATAPLLPGTKPMTPLGASENDQFAARVGDGEAPVATARAMANPARTVTQGTLIPAVLETAIDTDLPGYVRALVSQEVRSFDGSAVLIPRSSRLIGQYKSGVAAGQTRAYVIWSRLIRPDGASVALGSPAVEFRGTSGLAGKVDGHFMQRFGSAVLLSVVGGLGALGSSGSSVVLSGGGSNAASVAATRDSSIPPTIRVPQGQPIRVFTARDLDFSTVPAVVAVR